MTLAETDWRTWMMLAGIVILVVFLLRANRQWYARRTSESGGRGGKPADLARESMRVRDQLDDLMVQLAELARQTDAQIETRSAKVEALLADADRKIARLEQLVADMQDGPAPAPADEPPTDWPPTRAATRPEHQQVYDLAEAGHTPVQIASQLARDVGEVELILALRKKD